MDVKGIKVGLVGIYELYDHLEREQQLKDNIAKVKADGAQLIVVIFHWGNETETVPDSNQTTLGRIAIDEGADLVCGHHPHVLQGIETYKGRNIVYSLGNFCFGGNRNPSDKDTHVDYEDETGEKFQEYNVYHHNFVKWLEANGYDTSKLATISDEELGEWVAASPYHGATANDIDWVAKVKMQGAIQKWVDHSISVTVNLPNNVSEGLVAQVYRTAWECGCKGVTVYRDGCRDGVLLEKGSKKKPKCEEHPGQVPKRPKSIPADIVRFKNGTEDWIAFVGLQDGRPYEVFTGKIEEDAMYIPRKIDKGYIIKVREEDGTKRYDFQYTDRYGYTNTIGGISRLFDEEFWNYAKLISGVLRHGMPIEKTVSLIESLHLNSESINTWKTGVCRALKQYIVDGTKSKGKCPSCGQENMAYQNGCLTCMSCGYSKCG